MSLATLATAQPYTVLLEVKSFSVSYLLKGQNPTSDGFGARAMQLSEYITYIA